MVSSRVSRQVDMLHDKSQSYDFFSICKAQFVEKMHPHEGFLHISCTKIWVMV